MKEKRDFFIDILHVFVLFGFAVAQPLFDLLSRNPAFFVAHQSEPLDVILFILILCILPPALVFLIEAVAGLLGRGIRKGVHYFVVAGLVTIIILPALQKIFEAPGIVVLMAAAIMGAGFTVAYVRLNPVRIFLTVLSPVLLIFPALFLLNSQISKLVFVGDISRIFEDIPEVHATAPVVFVVFDAHTLTSLMNEDREIDAKRYPNFAALAGNAYWFRNATTVSDYTHIACPAIMSGLYPDKSRLPTFADYPRNIFTLLGGAYNIVVDDPNTKLCPKQLLSKWTKARIRNSEMLTQRLESLLLDSSIAYLHIIFPTDLCSGLPVVTRHWRNFMGDDTGTQKRNVKQTKSKPLSRELWLNNVTGERPLQVMRFIKNISLSEHPTLYYLHVVIPHEPWRYLPSGKEYCQPAEYKRIRGLDEGETWGSDEWPVIQAYQRYLLQVGFTDKLLGAIIDRVKAVGLYDRSLIIVTADHGCSFRTNDKRRPITKTNYQDIMPVPLLIKAPNQVEGEVSDRNVESIDILPSIADILGIPLPWPVDGQSIFNSSLPERTEKYFFRSVTHPGKFLFGAKKGIERLTFRAAIDEKYDTLDKMLSVFGSGKKPSGLYKIGSYNHLVGQCVNEINIEGNSNITVEVDQAKLYENVDPGAPFVPAQITGLAIMSRNKEGTPLNLAISVNGQIRAVTRTYPHKDNIHEWSAIVDEVSFQSGKNEIEIFHLVQKAGHLFVERTRKRSAVTYFLSGSDKKDSEIITTSEGKSIPVISEALQGFVDRAGIGNDRVKFSGWAADIKKSEIPETVLIFVDGDLFFSGRMNTKRPDVARNFNNQALQWSGFSYALLAEPFRHKKNPEVRIFAISKRGIASELNYPKGYQWCKKAQNIQ